MCYVAWEIMNLRDFVRNNADAAAAHFDRIRTDFLMRVAERIMTE